MKKAVMLAWVIALAAGGITVVMADSPMQVQLDALMAKWLWAIFHEYVDGYADCYWPEATVVNYDVMGQLTTLTGAKAIRQRQQGWADTIDFSKADLSWPEPTRFIPAVGDISVCMYVPKQFPGINIFYYQKRGSEVRILRQIELTYPK